MRQLFLVAAALCTACQDRPSEFGVSVFAQDTLPVSFAVTVVGSLAIGLRSEAFQALADKTLIMTTPAQLIIQHGEGTATIKALSGGPVDVRTIGTKPDSVGDVSAQGMIVKLARVGEERRVTLVVEKP